MLPKELPEEVELDQDELGLDEMSFEEFGTREVKRIVKEAIEKKFNHGVKKLDVCLCVPNDDTCTASDIVWKD